MKYLVLRPKGRGMCMLQILDADVRVVHPFTSWALRSGKQILFVEKGMGKALSTYYLGGSYYDKSGASYMTSYAEMMLILEDKLGPSDMQRALEQKRLFAMERAAVRQHRNLRIGHGAGLTAHVVGGIGMALLHVMFLGIKFVAFIVLFPFVISWLGKERHK